MGISPIIGQTVSPAVFQPLISNPRLPSRAIDISPFHATNRTLRDEIQAAITETQPIEDHRQHGLTQGHPRMRLLIEAVEVLHQPDLLAHSSDDPSMIHPFYRKVRHGDSPLRQSGASLSCGLGTCQIDSLKNHSIQQGNVRKMGRDEHFLSLGHAGQAIAGFEETT